MSVLAALQRQLGSRGMAALRSGEMFGQFRPGAPRQFAASELAPPAPIAGTPAAGRGPYGPRPNPMVEMQERQAMRNALEQLKRERRLARNQQELDEIDMEIATLRRDLGLGA